MKIGGKQSAEMAVDKQENFGEKLKYDPLWNRPMQQKRRQTDFPFLLSFIGFLLIWTGIVIYAFVVDAGSINDSIYKFKKNNRENDHKWKPVIAVLNAFGFFILAGVLSVLYIVLLRWFAKVIVYITIVIICALLFSTICASSYLYSLDKTQKELLYTAIASSIIFVITVIYLIVIYKKINIASEVIREASKAVIFFPSTLIAFPIFSYFLYGVLTIYFVIGVFPILCNGNCEDEPPSYAYFFVFIHVLGFLWVLNFVTGFAQMSLSGSFATWYWTMHKYYVPKYTVINCMAITSRYHLGTIAFGSLVISACRMITIILDLIRRCLGGRNISISCYFFSWYKFWFSKLEKLMKLIGRNAYIMTAIHGTDFMQSTKDVFNLFMRNILKVLVINKVTDGILFLGQLHAIGLTVFVAWAYYYDQESLTESLVTVGICSYLISKCYFLVLKTAIDTIFHCVMEDYERNDGSADRPYYMNFQLKLLLITEQNDEII